MPGILVGTDGSRHSQRALEWAVKEAGLRHAPLTVLTVHAAVAGHDGGMSGHTGDPGHDEYAREAAQADTDKALAGLDGPQPENGVRLNLGSPINRPDDPGRGLYEERVVADEVHPVEQARHAGRRLPRPAAPCEHDR